MEDKLNPIKLKTWASWTVSGFLEARVGVNQVHLVTSDPIRDRLLWKNERTFLHWVLFLVGGKYEPWVIAPYVMLPSGYVRRHLVSPVYLADSQNRCH